jgi:hypothetical protein
MKLIWQFYCTAFVKITYTRFIWLVKENSNIKKHTLLYQSYTCMRYLLLWFFHQKYPPGLLILTSWFVSKINLNLPRYSKLTPIPHLRIIRICRNNFLVKLEQYKNLLLVAFRSIVHSYPSFRSSVPSRTILSCRRKYFCEIILVTLSEYVKWNLTYTEIRGMKL